MLNGYRHDPGFLRRLAGNVLPCVLLALGVCVILFMSNEGCGDRPQDFRASGVAAVLGLAAAVGLSWLIKSRAWTDRLRYAAQIGVRLFLAYTFMGYGAAKVLDVQFAGTLFTLDSRFVDLAPMQVAWAFFGYSYTYGAFVGWSQIAAAVLLCFRRTTTLGAVLLLTVISNIVLVNVFYDVCVKLNSGIYLAMTGYLLLQDFQRLWAFFVANRPAAPRQYPSMVEQPAARRAVAVLRYLLIAFIVFYPFYDIHRLKTTYHIGERNAVYGAWQIERPPPEPTRPDSAAAATPPAWGDEWDKLFFEYGFWGIAKGEQGLVRFVYDLDTTRQQLTLTFQPDSTLNFTGVYRKPETGRMTLEGVGGADSVRMSLRLMEAFMRPRR